MKASVLKFVGDRTNWATAIGYEVENMRYLGAVTIFVYDDPIPDVPCEQVYFNQVYLEKHGFESVYAWLEKGKIVTLDVVPEYLYAVPKDLLQKCHLVITIDAQKWYSLIKEDDTVKLLTAFYTTAAVTVRDMKHAKPSDYQGDCMLTERDADV